MSKNILICGVGGQGTVLAAKVLSQAAVSGGNKVLSAETIGMAQRGGSVVSHVRIGDDVHSPLISKGQADIIISFEAAEAVRNLEYLKRDGMVIVNRKILQPVTASLTGKSFDVDTMISALEGKCQKVIVVDTEKACRDLGSPKVANVVLLGAACRTGLVEKSQVSKALEILVKKEFLEINMKALNYMDGE